MNSLMQQNLLRLKKTQGLPGWLGQWSESEGFEILFDEEIKLPKTFGDSNAIVIFDGYLHNRDEILRELKLSPRTNDAEIVHFAYSRWNEDLIYKLRGVFSLAIWDQRAKRLLLVRDHCGIYPSFYARKGSQIIFSTSVADIIRHPNVRAGMNRSAFVDYLCHRRPRPEETFYEEIHRVLPGHAVRFSNGTLHLIRYWYSTPPEGIQDYITDLESCGFDATLETAVSRCTQIGKTGIFLSGGLDSVSIASVAAEISKQKGTPFPMAFSLGFPHPDCNEVDKQTSVAQQLGLDIHLRQIDEILAGRALLNVALDLCKTFSLPMWDTWQALYIALGSDAKEMGYKVILTGSGGDEWMNVGDNLIADLIRLMDFRGLNRTVRIFLRSYSQSKRVLLWHFFWKAGLRLVLAEHARSLARAIAPGTLRKIIRKRMRNSTLPWVAADPELKAAADERVEVLVEEYMKRVLPKEKYSFYSNFAGNHFVDTITSMVMEQHFEASGHMGVRLLFPYFDPDLINLLVRISPEVLQHGGMEKGIVRRTVAKRFPNLKFEKQKKVSAIKYWQSMITTDGRDLYYGMGGVRSLIELGIVNTKEIGPVMEQAFSSKSPFDHGKIWDLLCLETWLRSH